MAEQDRSRGTRSLNGTIRAIEDQENQRRFRLSFSSEEPYERWFGPEILSHREGAVDLSRLNDMGVVLFNHHRDQVIGKITRAWVEEGRGMADIEFDTDTFSETIRQKVQSGTLKGVSVGYSVTSWEDVAEGHKSTEGFEGPCSIARLWTPFEISVVSVPADATVGVGRSSDTGVPQPHAPEPGAAPGRTLAEAERQIRNNEIIIRR